MDEALAMQVYVYI